MEAILNCYFDNFFGNLDRGSLFSRYKRKQIVEYLKTVIEGCVKAGECSRQEGCRGVVESVVKYHKKHRDRNGKICLLGKYHNVLYAGVRLCYDFLLEDSETVCELLDEIFLCEKTFERIFAGAIFGVRVSHFVAGWKSDFDDQEENVAAMLYFSQHSMKLKNFYGGKRFLDVPMTSVSNSSPLRVAAQVPRYDFILLLLRYGCEFDDENFGLAPILKLLGEICEAGQKYPENCLNCLQIFLRAVPELTAEEKSLLHCKLLEDEVVPPDRSGSTPPRLKHLCRCKIRKILKNSWQLPFGVEKLGIPKSLSNYLDLLED